MSGEAWALVAALGFGVTQTMNRKANQLTDAFRTTFVLLLAVEVVLVARGALTGEIALLAQAPPWALAVFGVTGVLHWASGWTLMALSQQRIGVARTGALLAATPIVGSVLAAVFLGEALSLATLVGVLLGSVGVALISLSAPGVAGRRLAWSRPWLALTVAVIWGITPLLIRIGLRGFDAPVMGLTVGLGMALVVYGLGLAVAGTWRREPMPREAFRWLGLGGLTGALGISAQWISFGLTTVAIAITLQNLSTLVVMALVPFMFREPRERLNLLLVAGVAAMLVGATTVVLAG